MYYYYNYDYLIMKISEKYKLNTLSKNMTELCRECHFNIARLKMNIENYNSFLQYEIQSIINVLGLNEDEIKKSFFNVEKTFDTKLELLNYVRSIKEQ